MRRSSVCRSLVVCCHFLRFMEYLDCIGIFKKLVKWILAAVHTLLLLLSTTPVTSREVMPTTLWLMILICSFQCMSAFLPDCRNWFSSFVISQRSNIVLLCPWTLTCDICLPTDLGRMRVNHHARYLRQCSFCLKDAPSHVHAHSQWTYCITRSQSSGQLSVIFVLYLLVVARPRCTFWLNCYLARFPSVR